DFARVLDQTPPGGKALGLVYDRDSKVVQASGALAGLPWYYSVERRGQGGQGVTTMAQPFCALPNMPCRLREIPLRPPAPGPYAPQDLDVREALRYFDYILTEGAPPPGKLFGARAGAVERLAAAGAWVVYRRTGAL